MGAMPACLHVLVNAQPNKIDCHEQDQYVGPFPPFA